MLLNKTDLLESQIQQYKQLVSNYEKTDSMHTELLSLNQEYYEEVTQRLNSELKKANKKKRLYKYGLIGTIGAAIISFIFIK